MTGLSPSDDLESLDERVYGIENANAATHVGFLINSFDTWTKTDSDAAFAAIFSVASASIDAYDTSKVALFGPTGSTVNLFAECCTGPVGLGRPRALLLYAVLLHRLHDTAEFPRRLRVLRNLIEASGSEIRAERMPALLADVRHLIVGEGALDRISSFNQAQVADEKLKVEMLKREPALERALFRLEDHPLLRGCVAAFELDIATFEARAGAFHDLFGEETPLLLISGALLTARDYARRIGDHALRLGSSVERMQWRDEILTGSTRAHLAGVRDALGQVLDAVASREGDVPSVLKTLIANWLQSSNAEAGLDWRWYFVRYPEMRAGRSGIYAFATATLGYSACMLEKKVMSSYYRDPYLTAIRHQSGVAETTVEGAVWQGWSGSPWFTGYETNARWMRLRASGCAMRCVEEGLLLQAPQVATATEAFTRICETHGIGPDLLLRIPQVIVDGQPLDTKDRVQLGAALLHEWVAAGL